MLGLGTVGTGVVRLLGQQRHLVLKKIAVRHLSKTREVDPPCPMTTNAGEVLDDPEIEIVVEVMGGEHPALEFMRRAIEKRKHIVTANKEVLAKHGPELFEQARKKGVAIFFEASVAGGIPLISTIQKGLEANEISSVAGILNGTTNFILSAMEERGEDFAVALKKAQELGYAESDPTNDVEAFDVAYKLSILSALAYGRFVKAEDIYRQGITKLTAEDIAHAREFGYRIKLIGTTQAAGDRLAVRVQPTLVPLSHPLSAVSGSHNGILVTGHAVGEIVMVGPGAGQMPTASAVVGDIINLASALQLPDFASYFQTAIDSQWAAIADAGQWRCPFYLRLEVADHPGVIGQIGTIFGDNAISIRSIIQRDTDDAGASVIILTHSVRNADMERALSELQKRDFLRRLASCMAIYDPTQPASNSGATKELALQGQANA
jgi:homoserine dehydrogenase